MSTSSSSATGGSWSTTPQTYVENRYYWIRTKVTWTVGNPTYAPSSAGVLDNAMTDANSKAYQALRTAGSAEDIANATKQYFWHDSDGVHVASEANAPTATRNTLWNSIGMIFRKGANYLLVLKTGTSPGIDFYDGAGTDSSHKVGGINGNEATFGYGKASIKYSEDGSAFGLQNSHRVVVSKATDESNVRNDATLSSRAISTFTASLPMAFMNCVHKVSGSLKSSQAGMYAWSGEGGTSGLVPMYVILQGGNGTGTDPITGDAAKGLYIKASKLVVNSVDWTNVKSNLDSAIADISDLETAIGNIGTTKSESSSTSTSLSAGTSKKVLEISLTAGVWIIVGHVRFASNSSSYRRINIATTSASSNIDVQQMAATGGVTNLQETKIVSLSSTTTLYLNAQSGVALNATAMGLDAVRIA